MEQRIHTITKFGVALTLARYLCGTERCAPRETFVDWRWEPGKISAGCLCVNRSSFVGLNRRVDGKRVFPICGVKCLNARSAGSEGFFARCECGEDMGVAIVQKFWSDCTDLYLKTSLSWNMQAE